MIKMIQFMPLFPHQCMRLYFPECEISFYKILLTLTNFNDKIIMHCQEIILKIQKHGKC